MSEMPSQRLTPYAFAKQEQVARSTVSRWIQSGRITLGADRRIDSVQGHTERLATESPLPQHQARKAQFDLFKAGDDTTPPVDAASDLLSAPTPPEPPSAGAAIGLGLKYQTFLLQKAKAELANLELDKAAGLLVERAEVDFLLADLGLTVRDQLDSLPDRLTPVLAACRGDALALHKALGDATRQALETITHHLQRRLDGLTGA